MHRLVLAIVARICRTFLVQHGFTQKYFRWQLKAVNSVVTRVTGNTDTLEVLKSDKRDNPCQG